MVKDESHILHCSQSILTDITWLEIVSDSLQSYSATFFDSPLSSWKYYLQVNKMDQKLDQVLHLLNALVQQRAMTPTPTDIGEAPEEEV